MLQSHKNQPFILHIKLSGWILYLTFGFIKLSFIIANCIFVLAAKF